MANAPGFINPRVAAGSAQAAAEALIPTILDQLSDVDTSTVPPIDGQALVFHEASGLWLPRTIAGAGPMSIDALSDVDTTTAAPTDGQALIFNEASGLWLPASLAAPAVAFADLTDVDETTAPIDGQTLVFDGTAGKWKPGTVGSGGGGGALVKLAEIELTANASTISFAALDQSHYDLILVLYPILQGGSGNVYVSLRFNGDAGANYDYRRWGPLDGEQTLNSVDGHIGATGYQSTGNMPIEATIYDYTNDTRREKFVVACSSDEGGGNYFMSWNNMNWHPVAAAAITSFDIRTTLPLLTGSRAVLYGRGG